MTAKPVDFSMIVGYALSAVFLVFGLVLLLGLTIPEYVPKEFRITMGVVLVLWGVYRFVLTRTKSKSESAEDA